MKKSTVERTKRSGMSLTFHILDPFLKKKKVLLQLVTNVLPFVLVHSPHFPCLCVRNELI